MGKLKFYRCNECGNLFLVLVDPSVKPVCCGDEMIELVPANVAEVAEKHIPVIEVYGNKATVRVGAAAHPMVAEHRIEWIAMTNGPRVDVQKLPLTGEPVADFTIRDNVERLHAYAFCNLHGLWESEA